MLFAADGLPKAERQNLPALPEILAYLSEVRQRTLAHIERLERPSLRLLHWLLQHEGQHAETIAMVVAMHHQNSEALLQKLPNQPQPNCGCEQIRIRGGEIWQGATADWAIDNERPSHRVHVDDFWMDCALVTCAQFAQFMARGGYEKKQWWSEQGWEWKVRSRITQPLYWSDRPALRQKPVCGVSWYEAAAYARSVGKRLPSESEWEAAASQQGQGVTQGSVQGLLGGVWEWTDTGFDGYDGFEAFPYAGYSQAYFDGEHRVLKGGSWASPSSIVRKSFRNWYHPHRRELFAGIRCVG